MKHENDRLDAVKESFRQWRCTRIEKGPIPEDLWQAAAKLWDSYSLCKIAKELKLDYNQLKHRIRPRWPQPQSFQLPQSQPCQFIEVHMDRIKIASNGAPGPCVPSLHVVETARMETILSYRGKGVTAEDVAFIRSLIEEHPGDSRRKLSSRLCRAWNWVQPNGELRDMVCRSLMLELERAGHLTLPPQEIRASQSPCCQAKTRGAFNRSNPRGGNSIPALEAAVCPGAQRPPGDSL